MGAKKNTLSRLRLDNKLSHDSGRLSLKWKRAPAGSIKLRYTANAVTGHNRLPVFPQKIDTPCWNGSSLPDQTITLWLSSATSPAQRWAPGSNFCHDGTIISPKLIKPKEARCACCQQHDVIRFPAISFLHMTNLQEHLWGDREPNQLGRCDYLACSLLIPQSTYSRRGHLLPKWVTLTLRDMKMASCWQVTLYWLVFHVTLS